MHSAFEAGDWEVCFQLQAEETFVNKDQANKDLDRSLKIWEHKRKFDAHSILSDFAFVDCLLKVFSIMRCWMVNTILDFSVTFWKLKWDLKYLEVV